MAIGHWSLVIGHWPLAIAPRLSPLRLASARPLGPTVPVASRLNNEQLVELGDLDELVRQVDRLGDAEDWDGLVDLRDRCRRALERGRQLWPAASLAEYRLALDAPGPAK